MSAIGYSLSLALLFVWSLPGTIALRSLLMLGALAALALALKRSDWRTLVRAAGLPLLLIGALTLWFIAQSLLLAVEPQWSLDELRGQWLPALLALLLGLMLALRAGRLATAITLVFAAQAAIAVGHSLWHWFDHGELLTQLVPLTGGKLEMSFILNLLLAFLTVDLFCRATGRTPLLRLPFAAVAAVMALALVGSILAGARNGIIGIGFLGFSAVSLFVLDQSGRLGPRRTLAAAAAIAAALATLAFLNYRSDVRWQTFAETAAIAWDIDSHHTWIDGNLWHRPALADGRLVEPSAYTRIAFIRGGARLIADQPLGYGYGRNAFAHALRQRHPDARLGHAHSGWIDLGVGGGVPALLLWGALLGGLAWRGWRSFFGRHNVHGLVLFLVAAGFAGRMALDSVNKDHMLQIFMFLVGILLVQTSSRHEGDSP
ncbi:MAG: O-antigen ligase family protein [Gammaproteobacteria bacterium]|nr:O-antigen ligase family protein [Gammaproteobacteria bacterium]MBU1647669.1 O-antigen ligase family protein [Gammaproteobacteria bacterium]MBU1971815.1 O-antigen ligase family protein [Gammaproteobacteria bacterium]